MIRTVITESEVPSSNRLKTLLKNFPNIRVIGEVFDQEETVSIIDGLKPDLLFLNLQLPVTDGLEILKSVSYRPTIIFTISYNRYIIKTCEENSVDYLLKPFSRHRFEKTLRRVLQQNRKLNQRQVEILQDTVHKTTYLNRFSLKNGHEIMIIPAENVFFFAEEDQHVYLHTFVNKFLLDIPLRELENLLDSNRFYRINKHHIVALEEVKKLWRNIRGKNKIVLNDRFKTALVVDKNYLSGLRGKLKNRYMSSQLS
jgi:DNA-binding LytR/AlgR family response regulator